MESELSGIFRVKLVTKNIVCGSLGTQFMLMRVKGMTFQYTQIFYHYYNNFIFLLRKGVCPYEYMDD